MNHVDLLLSTLNLIQVESSLRKEIISKYEQLANEEKEERAANKPRKVKRELVVVLDSPAQIDLNEVTASVWSVEEGFDMSSLVFKLRAASVDQNLATKKKKNEIKSWGDCISYLKTKFLKEVNIKRLAKFPSQVIQAPTKFLTEVAE